MPLHIQFWLQNFRKTVFFFLVYSDISLWDCACVRAYVCVDICYSALYLVLFCCCALAPLFLLNFVYFAQKVYSFGQLLSAFLCIYCHHRVVTDGMAQPVGLCSVWIWVVGLPRLSRKKPPEMKKANDVA